jgi:hypothetical protein
MEKHVTLVGIMRIGFSLLGILIALIVFVSVVGGGLLSGDGEAIAITGVVGSVIAGFLLLLSLSGLVGGIGLLKYAGWARILVLILAVIDLLNIPVGTAIGAYTIWVLLQDETIDMFESGARPLTKDPLR